MDNRKLDFLILYLCTVAFFFLTCVQVLGQASVYRCRSVSPPPSIDGNLDEPAWQQAQWIDLSENSRGDAPLQPGRVAALWDNEFLYLAFDFQDHSILSSITTRDARLWVQDVAEVFIAPSNNGRLYYEFQFSPLSNWRDVFVIHRGVPADFKVLQEWDTEATVKARVRGTLENNRDKDDGWSVEVAIQLSDLWLADGRPPQPGDRWRMNFYRIDYGEDEPELSAWCPTLKSTFHDPFSFGIVEFD